MVYMSGRYVTCCSGGDGDSGGDLLSQINSYEKKGFRAWPVDLIRKYLSALGLVQSRDQESKTGLRVMTTLIDDHGFTDGQRFEDLLGDYEGDDGSRAVFRPRGVDACVREMCAEYGIEDRLACRSMVCALEVARLQDMRVLRGVVEQGAFGATRAWLKAHDFGRKNEGTILENADKCKVNRLLLASYPADCAIVEKLLGYI